MNEPKPRLLDLFCGAGGAAMGYHRAGFEVVGVDINPQPRYPFEFHQADAMEYPLEGFSVIHASPPCQAYSVTRHTHSKQHPELLEPTITRLREWGGHWVVENVVSNRTRTIMPGAIEVCGAAFGQKADDVDGAPLVLKRHRLFLADLMLLNRHCACGFFRSRGVRVGGVYGAGPENRKLANRSLGTFRGGYTPTIPVRRELMGIDWMTGTELSQSIPPAYTEYIGRQLLQALKS